MFKGNALGAQTGCFGRTDWMLWAHRLDDLGAQTGCFGRTDWMFLVGLKARQILQTRLLMWAYVYLERYLRKGQVTEHESKLLKY